MLNVKGITRGQNNKALIGPGGRHRINSERDDIEVDTCRTHNGHVMAGDRCLRHTRNRVLHVTSRDGWRNRTHMSGADEAGIGDQPRA